MLAKCRMTVDDECPEGWVHITECQALSMKMLEIVKLQSSIKPMQKGDGDRLTYLWQFARVEAESAKEAVNDLHQRSQALVEEERANMHNRHVSPIRLDRYVV
jgi:DNA-directed RNA polymerase subunit F